MTFRQNRNRQGLPQISSQQLGTRGNGNQSLIKAWSRLETALQHSEQLQPLEIDQNEPPITDFYQFNPSSAKDSNKKQFLIRPQQQQQQFTRPLSSFVPNRPIVTTAASLKQFLNLKALSRPHTRPGTANPRVARKDIQILNSIDNEQYHQLSQLSQKIKGINVDRILDLYTARCQDQHVEYFPEQASKFLEKIQKNCKSGKANFSELGFGPNSAKILSTLIPEMHGNFVRINLEKNQLGNLGAIIIAEILREDQDIIAVNLASNDIGPEGAAAVFGALIENKTIISLNLSSSQGLNRNRIGPNGFFFSYSVFNFYLYDSAESLEWVLKQNKILEFLNISSTSIGMMGFQCITEGLKANRSLLSLDLSSNDLGPKCCRILVEILWKTKLIELNLSNNKIGNNGLMVLAECFRSGMKTASLERVNLSNNEITTFGFSRLCECLVKNQILQKLIINNNNLSGKGINSLIPFLAENQTIKCLFFNQCEINANGGESLANGLNKNNGLQILSLHDNSLSSFGAKCLAAAFNQNKNLSLKYLDLSRNKINDDSGNVLIKSLEKLEKLETLNFRENQLQDNSGFALISLINKNNNIKKINLEMNPLSFKIIQNVKKGIIYNINFEKRSRIPKFQERIEKWKRMEKQTEQLQDQKYQLQKEIDKIEEECQEHRLVLETEKAVEKKKNEKYEIQFDQVNKELVSLERNGGQFIENLDQELIYIQKTIDRTDKLIGETNSNKQRLQINIRNEKDDAVVNEKSLKNQKANLEMKLENQQKELLKQQKEFESYQTMVLNLKKKIQPLLDQREKKQQEIKEKEEEACFFELLKKLLIRKL